MLLKEWGLEFPDQLRPALLCITCDPDAAAFGRNGMGPIGRLTSRPS